MKEVTCYKLDDGTLYEDKEQATKAEQAQANRNTLDYTQVIPFNFKLGDTVYVSARDKVRQCLVISIETTEYSYDENNIERYTTVDLTDINDKEESIISYWTSELRRDLNKHIKLSPLELCNFNYEECI